MEKNRFAGLFPIGDKEPPSKEEQIEVIKKYGSKLRISKSYSYNPRAPMRKADSQEELDSMFEIAAMLAKKLRAEYITEDNQLTDWAVFLGWKSVEEAEKILFDACMERIAPNTILEVKIGNRITSSRRKSRSS